MEKFILKSKTVQGIVVSILPMLSNLFGFDWTEQDNTELGAILELFVTLVGATWAFYGRMRAGSALRLIPLSPSDR